MRGASKTITGAIRTINFTLFSTVINRHSILPLIAHSFNSVRKFPSGVPFGVIVWCCYCCRCAVVCWWWRRVDDALDTGVFLARECTINRYRLTPKLIQWFARITKAAYHHLHKCGSTTVHKTYPFHPEEERKECTHQREQQSPYHSIVNKRCLCLCAL